MYLADYKILPQIIGVEYILKIKLLLDQLLKISLVSSALDCKMKCSFNLVIIL